MKAVKVDCMPLIHSTKRSLMVQHKLHLGHEYVLKQSASGSVYKLYHSIFTSDLIEIKSIIKYSRCSGICVRG